MNLHNRFSAAKAATVGAVATVAAAPLSAFAALDLDAAETAILADITTVGAFVLAVGLAVLTMIFIAKGVRWARKAG